MWEGGRGRERHRRETRHKDWGVTLRTPAGTRDKPHPRYAPLPGLEPAAVWPTGRRSNREVKAASASCSVFVFPFRTDPSRHFRLENVSSLSVSRVLRGQYAWSSRPSTYLAHGSHESGPRVPGLRDERRMQAAYASAHTETSSCPLQSQEGAQTLSPPLRSGRPSPGPPSRGLSGYSAFQDHCCDAEDLLDVSPAVSFHGQRCRS